MSLLFDRIGGEPAVNAAVDVFYKKVLADDHINHFFENIDMESQHRKQKLFFSTLFKGEAKGVEGYMRRSHKDLVEKHGLNESHFVAVATHLNDTLNELGLPSDIVTEIMTGAASLKDAVLNK